MECNPVARFKGAESRAVDCCVLYNKTGGFDGKFRSGRLYTPPLMTHIARPLATLGIVALTILAWGAAPATRPTTARALPAVGDSAPDFTLSTLDKRAIALQDRTLEGP